MSSAYVPSRKMSAQDRPTSGTPRPTVTAGIQTRALARDGCLAAPGPAWWLRVGRERGQRAAAR